MTQQHLDVAFQTLGLTTDDEIGGPRGHRPGSIRQPFGDALKPGIELLRRPGVQSRKCADHTIAARGNDEIGPADPKHGGGDQGQGEILAERRRQRHKWDEAKVRNTWGR